MTSTRMRRAGAATFAIAGALAGCQSLQTSENFLGILTPYRVEVVQGNVITSEQVALAKPGLTRAQVREVLGSPLLTDPFHADRWDYVFTIRRQADVGMVGEQDAKDVLGAHVALGRVLEHLEHLDARQRGLEAAVLDFLGVGHGIGRTRHAGARQ